MWGIRTLPYLVVKLPITEINDLMFAEELIKLQKLHRIYMPFLEYTLKRTTPLIRGEKTLPPIEKNCV